MRSAPVFKEVKLAIFEFIESWWYAVTHYIYKYGFVPPYVLVKILTFGVASSYYGLLK